MPTLVEKRKNADHDAGDSSRVDSGRPVVLITGASSGFGAACARRLAAKGYRVFGTSRKAHPSPASDPPPKHAPTILLSMDVCDPTSVRQGVDFVHREAHRIDVVVCNAGFGIAGAVEDTTAAEAQNQFQTNFFGVWRVCRAVLPHMRRQGGGYIVIVSSLAGLMGIPFQAAYSASKFALEGFAEALRMEVKPWGIHVVLIEPGDFRTGFTQNRVITAGAGPHSAFKAAFERALAVIEADERGGPGPDQVARLLERIITQPSPRLRYTAGSMLQRSGALLKRILPGRTFEWLMMQTYKLR